MHRSERPLPCSGKHHLFFSEEAQDERKAVALCRPCPERVGCLKGALERGEEYGTWGAKTRWQRLGRKPAVATINPTTPDVRDEILRLDGEGWTRLEISKKLSLTKAQVVGILRRARKRELNEISVSDVDG